jgi:hypothetical protein
MISRNHADTLGGFTLTTHGFPDFYRRILALRFPISVAEVLELRDLINHSADVYQDEPAEFGQTREFRDSLETAIQSFGVENRHHSDRLLKVLVMLRGMHYHHTITSRDQEQHLRQQQADNRARRRIALRNGMLALMTTGGAGGAWLLAPQAGGIVQGLALASALVAFGYFRLLPRIDLDMERLTADLNRVLRQRVESINWRTLIHKLALLLGYKRIQGVEVFRQESADFNSGSYLLQ